MVTKNENLIPSVSVVIPAYNAEKTLGHQLQALNAQTELEFDVVVCDNGSTDRTRVVVEGWDHAFRSLTWLRADGHKGAAHARNVGLEMTSTEMVLLCDADDAVSPGWVAAHVKALRFADATTGPLHIVKHVGQASGEEWNSDSLPRAMNFLQYLPSCNAGFRRSAFAAIGGFDESLWRGHEDVDFGWRLELAGFRLLHVPEAEIDYVQRSGLKETAKQQFRYGQAFAELYRKYRFFDIPGQSSRWRARWWLELMRQTLIGQVSFRRVYSTISFQLGRVARSRKLGLRTPMW